MGKEIERKFLVKNNRWQKNAKGVAYKQGYLSTNKGRTVRVRVQGEDAFLTIKGPVQGIIRQEFEYPIPVKDALELFEMCEKPLIEKTRYKIVYDNLIWEIDVFAAENKGLILAEVELSDEKQKVNLPDWIGKEVTGNRLYYNANLVLNPFTRW